MKSSDTEFRTTNKNATDSLLMWVGGSFFGLRVAFLAGVITLRNQIISAFGISLLVLIVRCSISRHIGGIYNDVEMGCEASHKKFLLVHLE